MVGNFRNNTFSVCNFRNHGILVCWSKNVNACYDKVFLKKTYGTALAYKHLSWLPKVNVYRGH